LVLRATLLVQTIKPFAVFPKPFISLKFLM